MRERLEREYRETGAPRRTGDGSPMGELVEFRRSIMALRRKREREGLGLSLSDVADQAGTDNRGLSRLAKGQQLNPTVNTLAPWTPALGKSIAWGIVEAEDR